MGQFKTETMRTMKRMDRAEGEVQVVEPVPNGFRNNRKNQQLFKTIREAKLHKMLQAVKLK